jgi:hypothetical protein
MTGAAKATAIGGLIVAVVTAAVLMAYTAIMVWRDPRLREEPHRPSMRWPGFRLRLAEMAYVFGLSLWLTVAVCSVGVVVLYVIGMAAIELAGLGVGA